MLISSRRSRVLVLLVLIFALAALLAVIRPTFAEAAPTEVWVDSEFGDDNNDGSRAAPFKTLAKAFEAVAVGGTVYALPGGHIAGPIPKSMTIRGAHADSDDGDPSRINAGEFVIQGLQKVTIEGLAFAGAGSVRLIEVSETELTVRRNTFTSAPPDGGRPAIGTKGGKIRVENNTFTHYLRPLLIEDPISVSVVGNTFGGFEADKAEIRNASGALVRGNTFHSASGSGLLLESCRECLVAGNEFTGLEWDFVVLSLEGGVDNAVVDNTFSTGSKVGTAVQLTGETGTAIRGNRIDRFFVAVWAVEDSSGLTLRRNDLASNDVGLTNFAPRVDALCNWWGGRDRPKGHHRHGDTLNRWSGRLRALAQLQRPRGPMRHAGHGRRNHHSR